MVAEPFCLPGMALWMKLAHCNLLYPNVMTTLGYCDTSGSTVIQIVIDGYLCSQPTHGYIPFDLHLQ